MIRTGLVTRFGKVGLPNRARPRLGGRMITIKITNTKQIVLEKKGWFVANVLGAVVDLDGEVEAIVMERLRAALTSEGVEAILEQVRVAD